jgi:polysaccharide export outer membrane protein
VENAHYPIQGKQRVNRHSGTIEIARRCGLLILGLGFGLCSVAEIEEYVLQPGDVIAVTVVEHPEFSGRHKIRPDGRINYAVIGELDVASLTCAQLVKIMQGKLSSYVNNPVVSVSIEAYYANKIFVIGAVNRPGQYEIFEPIDVLKVVAMCGGLENSKTKEVKIVRADGTVVAIQMRQLLTLKGKRDARQFMLYPGDTLYVPEPFRIEWQMVYTIVLIISVSLSIFVAFGNLSGKS